MLMRIALSLCLLVALLSSPVYAAPPSGIPADIAAALKSFPAYASDRILVRFKPGTPAASVAKLHRQTRTRTLKTIPRIDVRVVKVPAGEVQQKLKAFRANPNIEFAEPDYHRILVLPTEGTDPPPPDGTGVDFFPEQWGMHNTGQLLIDPTFGIPLLTGTPDADIDAPEAWDIHTGDASIKLAILDSGINCSAVDLAGKCVEQTSFVTAYSPTVDDWIAHGTHVAGIAAANSDNAKGTAGVGWHTSIGNLKACYEYDLEIIPGIYYITVGVCPVSASAAAITYAADNGYHVINMSYGSDVVDATGAPVAPSAPPNAESAAVAYAWNQGVVIVAAAGNDANTAQLYPAAYDEVIAVGATDRYDNLASFSTFGNTWVSMLAPGENILSTEPDGSCQALIPGYVPGVDDCLTWKSGTSMASPHVAGAAALLWAQLYPGQAPSTCVASSGQPCNTVVRAILENSADASGALAQNFLAWSQSGRLNIFSMLSDGDADGITSPVDNCPDIANPGQANNDGDGEGDACDTDDDNDGLVDSLELGIGTDPFNADSDGDTLSDFEEVNFDGDPTSYIPGLDLDPLRRDTDNDGIDDNLDPVPLSFNYNDGDLAPLGAPDGLINAADVLVATRIVLEQIPAGDTQLVHGDVYPAGAPDGEINVQDLILITDMALH